MKYSTQTKHTVTGTLDHEALVECLRAHFDADDRPAIPEGAEIRFTVVAYGGGTVEVEQLEFTATWDSSAEPAAPTDGKGRS